MGLTNLVGLLFYPIRGFYEFLHHSSGKKCRVVLFVVKKIPYSHDEELKRLSNFTYLPYNTTFTFFTQVAVNSPDFLFHYHFIQRKNVMKGAETRLLGMIIDRIKKSQNGLAEIEEKVMSELKEYSPTTQCLISQKEQCVSKRFGQYEYSICTGGEAKQDSVLLGKWNLDLNRDYVKNSTIEFNGGNRCWNGIERKLVAKYQCGRKEKILSLTEPSTCHYEAVIESPCFCSEELVDSIKAKLV